VKVRVPISGTVGKAVFFDPEAGARAEAAVAALAAQISAGIGGSIQHSALRNLQVGDDHPQYTGWQFPETIVGQWNFQTIPQIQGETLAEYIQDVVGADFFDFLQDTSSVVWTYLETANELEANVPPEFVQDVIGGSLTTTSSVALSYNDLAGTFAADVIPEFVQDTVGAMLTTTSSIAMAYDDGAGTFNAAIVDEYVQDLVDALMIDSTSIAWTYGDVGNTLSAATINANPSGLIGMTAVNGTAATPLRSDGRHAIDPAIAPTWTALHTYALAGTAGAPSVDLNSSAPVSRWYATGAAANEKSWILQNLGGPLALRAVNDAGTAVSNAFTMFRTGLALTDLEFGNFTDLPNIAFYGNMRLLSDARELQLGVGQDLRLFHDGTDSWVRNDTGVLNINQGATTVGRFDSDATGGNTRFMVYDVDNATLERVSVGAADSGGVGFKVLRIPN
jgi:hypothetical protein